jgi:hypothetical protein
MPEQLDEGALALAAARKKLRTAGSDPERLRRLLGARGFTRATIEEALGRLREQGPQNIEERDQGHERHID